MLLKVNAKGQITLPQNLRKELGIKPGDSVLITQKDGEFVLTPVKKRCLISEALCLFLNRKILKP